MSAEPLRRGVVGTGWIATDHIFLLGKLGHHVVAVCDLDRARAERLHRTATAVYEDWNELLDRETLDALWVATPPLHHRGPAVAAMERGLPVFLEKPVARTVEDAEAIVDGVAAHAGQVCAIGYQWHATEGLETCATSSPASRSPCCGV